MAQLLLCDGNADDGGLNWVLSVGADIVVHGTRIVPMAEQETGRSLEEVITSNANRCIKNLGRPMMEL